ncbi:armadillo repeat-containing protein 3-like isoform X2 [Anneissia japonica]|uniref:armadillo repeat-containing protein 3-like isoform X2 n=1 Tax=Anneissia japonica TaxID=1529436 RepID=UPI001425B46E|nr:armadillo repeat-containing protein 3-like isoform X2 [Anneissia japonica]
MGKKTKKENDAPPKDVFDPVAIESKKAATVVLMLSSPEDSILIKGCEALYKYAEKCDENKALLMELGAVPPLLQLIMSVEKTVRRNATMALGVLSGHADVRRLLRKADCIPNIIKLLGPEEETLVHEFSSLCLANMAQEFIAKEQIMENDGLDPLILLLSDSDADVQRNSAEAIYLLLQDYSCRSVIRDLGGLPPLLELLKSEYPIIQETALKCLISCTQELENREAMREIEGLERLVDFIGNKEWEELHVHALLVMANCLEDVESMELIQSTGGLQKLMAFAAESQVPEVQSYTAKAMARAARNSENCKIFHEQDGEKTLIVLLEVENAQVQTSCCQALAIMAENPLCRSTIYEYDGIGPIVKLLTNEDGDVREAASLAIANLTTALIQNCVEVSDRNGISPLIELLSDSKEGAQANAASALTNLATDEILRTETLGKGVVGALITPMQSSNTNVQSKALLALASYLCDAEAKTQFRGLGGLSPLLKLLQSNNDEVRRAASWAVVVCASDPLIATELCKIGGLEVLQNIQQSSTKQNSFSDSALERLLDNALSAKYALTGQLSSCDVITDGFYDVGKMRPGSKFMTLEELSQVEVNQKRPILLVNFTPSRSVPPSPVPVLSDSDVKQDSKTQVSGRSSRALIKGAKRESKKEREERELRERLEAERLEEQQALLAQQPPAFEPPSDPKLEEYLNDVVLHIAPLPTTREQVVSLAQFVSDKMGGSIERGQLSSFSYELPISQLKYDLQSNVIQIGKVTTGIHYHRALLFKALADRIGVASTLTRGDYNRAWNVVMLVDDESVEGIAPRFPPKAFIIDLIHEPGRLMRSDSSDAVTYQSI